MARGAKIPRLAPLRAATYAAEPFSWVRLLFANTVRLCTLMVVRAVAGPLALASALVGAYLGIPALERLHDAILDAVSAVDDRLGAIANGPSEWLWAQRHPELKRSRSGA